MYRTEAEKYYNRVLIIGLMIPTFRINFPASPIFEFDNHPLSDLKSYEVRKIEKTRKPQIFCFDIDDNLAWKTKYGILLPKLF